MIPAALLSRDTAMNQSTTPDEDARTLDSKINSEERTADYGAREIVVRCLFDGWRGLLASTDFVISIAVGNDCCWSDMGGWLAGAGAER
jgi:hypothetical protein